MTSNKRRVSSLPSTKGLIGVFLLSVLGGIILSEGEALKSLRNFGFTTLWSMVIWYTQWFGNGYIIYLLDQKIPWLKFPVRRLIIGFLSLILYSFIAIVIVNLSFYKLLYGELPEVLYNWLIFNARISISISLVIASILTSVGFFQSWRKSAGQEEKLKLEMLDYRYKSLLNQVNPHFLFNSLNVLTALVYEDQELAVRFIRQLSKVYRYTLENKERDLVSLKEEGAYIESYVFLLKIRFEEALQIEANIPDEDDKYLIPMALQIVLENAIKHNSLSKSEPLKITIDRDGDYLVVRNNLQRPIKQEESTGFGLENVQKRLAFLSDKKLITEIIDGYFIARIPILTLVK